MLHCLPIDQLWNLSKTKFIVPIMEGYGFAQRDCPRCRGVNDQMENLRDPPILHRHIAQRDENRASAAF